MIKLNDKTFEELADEIGLATIFTGTDADEAMQQTMLEWFYEYKLCDEDSRFLRVFRRRFNNLYPRYLEQVRILTVLNNFDPYVTDYFQDIIKNTGTENITATRTGESAGTTSVTDTAGKVSTTVRTPDLTTETQDSNSVTNTGSVINSGSDSTAHTGTDTTAKTGTETTDRSGTDTTTRDNTDTATHTGTDTTVLAQDESTDSTAKTDGFGIDYPEANLVSLNVDPDAQRDIAYASSEQLSATKTSTSDDLDSTTTVTHNTQDRDVTHAVDETEHDTTDTITHNTTDTATHNTIDTTNYGSRANTTDNTVGENNSTQTQTGTETTQTTNSGSDTALTTTTNATDETNATERSNNGQQTHEHKGRNESVADIVPRAMRAIMSNNELLWFRDSMRVCFNCTDL